jgi:hypothetical protein
MSVPTALSATKPRRSALLHQGRLACPDAKRAGLSRNDRSRDGARLTIDRILIKLGGKSGSHVIADRGYDANHIQATLREQGMIPVIPGRRNRKRPIQYNKRR